MKKSAIKWRVKHSPAKTVYTKQCHSVLTLTYGFGQPIHPANADFVARAERKDVPEHWALWGLLGKYQLAAKFARYQGGREGCASRKPIGTARAAELHDKLWQRNVGGHDGPRNRGLATHHHGHERTTFAVAGEAMRIFGERKTATPFSVRRH